MDLAVVIRSLACGWTAFGLDKRSVKPRVRMQAMKVERPSSTRQFENDFEDVLSRGPPRKIEVCSSEQCARFSVSDGRLILPYGSQGVDSQEDALRGLDVTREPGLKSLQDAL